MTFPHIDPYSLDRIVGMPLAHRFVVHFLIGGVVPNPLDIRFQRVSGIGTKVETADFIEGGQNLYTHRLPTRIGHQNLVLERGLVIGSPLGLEVNQALTRLSLRPSNVLVMLLAESGIPTAAWMFVKTYPVSWSVADLDGQEARVLVETLELAYARMQALEV